MERSLWAAATISQQKALQDGRGFVIVSLLDADAALNAATAKKKKEIRG